jgi:predicted metal-dependent phosphoesterase TrpH
MKRGIFNSDLHTHSFYSDGMLSPKELMRLAKKNGVKNIALTDHDSTEGVKEALKEAKKIGLNLIQAVELGFEGGEMLGYFIDIDNKRLQNILMAGRKISVEKLKQSCLLYSKLGIKISFKEIKKRFPNHRNNLNGFFLFYMLYLKGYGNNMEEIGIMLKKLKEGNNLKIYSKKRISAVKAIKIILQSGGVPILAHPWLSDEFLNEKNFKKLVKAGLKGLEISNGDNNVLRKSKYVSRINHLLKDYNLIGTRGTDFHGKKICTIQPGNHFIGKNNCDERVVKALYSLSKQNSQ